MKERQCLQGQVYLHDELYLPIEGKCGLQALGRMPHSLISLS